MNPEVGSVGGYAAVLGEGLLWSPEHDCLYWLDNERRKVVRLRAPWRESETRDLPFRPSCLMRLADGRLLVGYRKGIGVFDFETGRNEPMPLEGVDFSVASFNDGACDVAGNLWIGTRHRTASEPAGVLYRIGPDFKAQPMADGIVLSNGIAWSPDARTLYHVDSRHRGHENSGCVYAYDFDPAASTLANRRVFLDYTGKGRRPDGCTVDAEGGLWVAEIAGSRVARYTPDGRLDREIAVPVSKPSNVAFGGDGMATLFITSIRYGLDAAALEREPEAGVLMACRPGVRGVSERTFGRIGTHAPA
jgi:sugar lactone lactonase YvrE